MRRFQECGSTLLILSWLISQAMAQEVPNLAGELEKCRAGLSNCQLQIDNADLKKERDQLRGANAQLRELHNQLQTTANSMVVNLYNTPAAQGAQQVINNIKAHPPKATSYTQNGVTHILVNLYRGDGRIGIVCVTTGFIVS